MKVLISAFAVIALMFAAFVVVTFRNLSHWLLKWLDKWFDNICNWGLGDSRYAPVPYAHTEDIDNLPPGFTWLPKATFIDKEPPHA